MIGGFVCFRADGDGKLPWNEVIAVVFVSNDDLVGLSAMNTLTVWGLSLLKSFDLKPCWKSKIWSDSCQTQQLTPPKVQSVTQPPHTPAKNREKLQRNSFYYIFSCVSQSPISLFLLTKKSHFSVCWRIHRELRRRREARNWQRMNIQFKNENC